MPEQSTRPLRADAQRNRDRILSTATRIFAEEGLGAGLERIAQEAGVGIGTLYRNFPSREALVDAAYRSELARVCDAAPALLAELAPDDALRTWMSGYLDYTTAKFGMADALRAMMETGRNPYEHSRELLLAAVSLLLTAAQNAGTVRDDVVAEDVIGGLLGTALALGRVDQRQRAERLLDLLMDGLRAGAG